MIASDAMMEWQREWTQADNDEMNRSERKSTQNRRLRGRSLSGRSTAGKMAKAMDDDSVMDGQRCQRFM